MANEQWGGAFPQGTGHQASTIQPNASVSKIKNVLSDEEVNKLIQKENTFSLALTETEKLRAICTHRFPDGRDALQDIGQGMQRCQICGHTFLPTEVTTSREAIVDAVNAVTDVLQTIKLLYLDMPVTVAREYFVIIALLQKIPDLFEHACKDYIRHEQFLMPGMYSTRAANVMSIWNMITGGITPQMAGVQYDGYGRPIDPQYSPNSMYGMGNPFYNPQFMQNYMQGTPLNPMGGMGMGGPTMGGQPYGYSAETTGFSYTPPVAGETEEERRRREEEERKRREAGITEVATTFKA